MEIYMHRYKKQQGLPVTFTLIFLMILTFILQKANPTMFVKYFALKGGFVDFYPWQFVSYIFLENISGFTFFFKALIVFMFSSSLEAGWSSTKLGIFLVLTVLPKSIIAAIFSIFTPGLPLEAILNGVDGLLNPNSLFLSLMIAYGFLHREEVIYLFFIIPIKIWTLAVISIIFAAIGMLGTLATMGLPLNVILTIIQLSGYLGILVFSGQIFRLANVSRKYHVFRKKHVSPDTITLEETRKVLEEMIKITEETREEEKRNSEDNNPLCDPIDFDENDQYCKDCEKFKRCLERKKTTK